MAGINLFVGLLLILLTAVIRVLLNYLLLLLTVFLGTADAILGLLERTALAVNIDVLLQFLKFVLLLYQKLVDQEGLANAGHRRHLFRYLLYVVGTERIERVAELVE